MTEVSLTDSEDEDTDDPLREPHDTIGKATICKYYSHFKKAIGTFHVIFETAQYLIAFQWIT